MNACHIIKSLGLALGISYVFASMLCASDALALDDHQKPDSEKTLIAIQTDNDFYGAGRDEDYTFGQRINIGLPFRKEPKWLMRALDWLPIGSETKHRRYNLTYGQSVFTPRNIKTEAVIANDRPYAAHMYLGIGYADPSDYHTDLFNITVGMTDDFALGKFSQKTLHDLKGSKDPAGWDNQVGTEPTVMMQYTRIYAGREGSPLSGDFWDVTPHMGMSIGSPYTHALTGVTFRAGTGLDREAGGAPTLQPQMAVHDIYHSSGEWAFNLMAGVEARTVLYNFSLDGALFAKNSQTIDKKTFTGHVYAGLTIYKRSWRLGYMYILKAKEYEGQQRRHRYGAITLSRYF